MNAYLYFKMWAEKGRIEHNSFLGEGVQIEVGSNWAIHYPDSKIDTDQIDLSNNYWGTTSPEEIDAKIRDYNDDLIPLRSG